MTTSSGTKDKTRCRQLVLEREESIEVSGH